MNSLELLIGGFTPFSMEDFPNRFSAIVFLQGCLWRCPYCHNGHLQSCQIENERDAVSWQYVLDFLIKRKNNLDGLVFSGGEPLIQPAIFSAIEDIKKIELEVAIHTNGSKPDVLSKIISMVDWVGLDIKAPDYLYEKITGGIGIFDDVQKSLDVLIKSDVDFEVRTTVFPKDLGEKEIFDIAKNISDKGVRKYVLQEYRSISNNKEIIEEKSNILRNKEFLKEISSLFDDFSIRFA